MVTEKQNVPTTYLAFHPPTCAPPGYRSGGQNAHEAPPLAFLGRKCLQIYGIPHKAYCLNPQMRVQLRYPA